MTQETWMAIATILVPVALAIASGIFGLVGWVLWKLIEALMAKYEKEHQDTRRKVEQLEKDTYSLIAILKRGGVVPSHFNRDSPPLHISESDP